MGQRELEEGFHAEPRDRDLERAEAKSAARIARRNARQARSLAAKKGWETRRKRNIDAFATDMRNVVTETTSGAASIDNRPLLPDTNEAWQREAREYDRQIAAEDRYAAWEDRRDTNLPREAPTATMPAEKSGWARLMEWLRR